MTCSGEHRANSEVILDWPSKHAQQRDLLESHRTGLHFPWPLGFTLGDMPALIGTKLSTKVNTVFFFFLITYTI